jgi:hypothetical protein
MASLNPVQGNEALTLAVKNNFADTYAKDYTQMAARLEDMMELAIPSDQFKEIYAYSESRPIVKRRPDGDSRHIGSYRYRSFEIVNYAWQTGVEWDTRQAIYDQLGTIESDAAEAGSSFAGLSERVFFQLVQSTTDTDLLANSSPNAPDGAALYSTTDGASANRFGVSNGNLLSGSGVATAQAIRDDMYSAAEQFELFQDTQGEPLFSEGTLDQGYVILAGTANKQIFEEAFLQVRSLDGSVIPTNILLDGTLNVTLHTTQRITDNDWYIFAKGARVKPIVEQIASPLQEMYFDQSNSDRARFNGVAGFLWEEERGYGINLPYGTIKVNN